MRQLRFVRSADESSYVIVETADGQEQFRLRVDPGLRDAVRSDLPRLTPSRPEPETATVGPREIQTRVRAGESAQAIAEQYQIGLDRVLRFAGPVLEERRRIANEARRGRARRSTTEGQTVVFGEAVDERFASHGIDPATVSWDARRREDGQWVIAAGWRGGESDRVAEWVLHLATRTVTPLDDTAADLLSDRPIRPVLTQVAGPVRPSLAAAPPLAPGVVAFPVMPDAHTGPLPRPDEVFDQDAPDLDAPRRPVRAHDAPVSTASGPTAVATGPADPPAADAVGDQPSDDAGDLDPSDLITVDVSPAGFEAADYDEVPLPLTLPGTTGPDGSNRSRVKSLSRPRHSSRPDDDEERAARARIPSWDDILLGVRRKSD